MTPEKAVQNSVINLLNSLKKSGEPILFERRSAGGFNYKKGSADLWASIYGIHVEIEIKSKSGSLSTLQERFKEKCERLQVCWLCINDVKDLKEFLLKNFDIKC